MSPEVLMTTRGERDCHQRPTKDFHVSALDGLGVQSLDVLCELLVPNLIDEVEEVFARLLSITRDVQIEFLLLLAALSGCLDGWCRFVVEDSVHCFVESLRR